MSDTLDQRYPSEVHLKKLKFIPFHAIEKFYMLTQHFEMVDFNSSQLRVHLDTESTIGYSMDKVVWIIQALQIVHYGI